MATLVPSTPICLFFNLAKVQCKQTMVTDFCIGLVNNIHIIGKGMIKETWIAKIKEIGCWTEELITFCPFSPVSAWSKKLPNFAVKHVDLSWDFGHDVPCMGRRTDVNNEGGLGHKTIFLIWAFPSTSEQNLTWKVKIMEPVSLLIFNEKIEALHTKHKTKAMKIIRIFFVVDFPHFLTKNVGMLLSVFLDRHNVPTGISLQSNGNELRQNWSCFCFSYADLLFQFKFQRHNDTVCYKTDSHCWDVMVDIFLISTGKLKYFKLGFSQ